MDHYKSPNMQWFGGMANFFEKKALREVHIPKYPHLE
jgi:hypothetical protein